jgi:hypothetical protein
MLLRTLSKTDEFHAGWPASVHGEDCFGHLVFYEAIEARAVQN